MALIAAICFLSILVFVLFMIASFGLVRLLEMKGWL